MSSETATSASLPEDGAELGIDLVRIDPERNMRRFYSMRYELDLFGQWLLIRRWGRIGRSCQVRRDLVDTREKARQSAVKLAAAKIRKGYRLDPA